MKPIEKPMYIKLYEQILENITNKKYSVTDKLLKDEGDVYTQKGKLYLKR